MKRAKSSTKPAGVPKYTRVCDQIRSHIENNKLTPGARLPSQVDFAEQLKVNHLTVVRALQELMREGLVVRRKGSGTFVADHNQRPFILGRKLKLGLLWPKSVYPEGVMTTLWGDMSLGALAEWGVKDVDPTFPLAANHETSRGIWRAPRRDLTVVCLGESRDGLARRPEIDAVRKENFDGLIALSIIEEDWLEELYALGIPLVLVDFPTERFASRVDQVFIDPLSGYREAVRHYVRQGIKRIHFVGSLTVRPAPSDGMSREQWQLYQNEVGRFRTDPDTFLRLSAYRQAMDAAGLSVTENCVHHAYSNVQESLRPLGKRLAGLPEAERPEAVVCHNRSQAEALIELFKERGFQLRGAGASLRGESGRADAIHIEGRRLGEIAAHRLRTRLLDAREPVMDVGIKMEFRPADHARKPQSDVSQDVAGVVH